MSVEGFSDKVCACGCGNLLPLSLMWKPGRKFLYNHKPKEVGAAPVGDGQRRSPRASPATCVGYDPMRELVERNLAAANARRLEIEEEIQTLRDELTQMDGQHAAVMKGLAELEALRAALAPFCAPVAIADIAPELQEATA